MEKAEIEVSDQIMFCNLCVCIMVGRNRIANFDPFATLQLKNVSLIDDNLQRFCYLKKEVDGTGL